MTNPAFNPHPTFEEHLADILLGFWIDKHNPQPDAAYFRFMAEEFRQNPAMYQNRDYPSPEDVFTPTAADMDEEADKIECGFEGGEFI